MCVVKQSGRGTSVVTTSLTATP